VRRRVEHLEAVRKVASRRGRVCAQGLARQRGVLMSCQRQQQVYQARRPRALACVALACAAIACVAIACVAIACVAIACVAIACVAIACTSAAIVAHRLVGGRFSSILASSRRGCARRGGMLRQPYLAACHQLANGRQVHEARERLYACNKVRLPHPPAAVLDEALEQRQALGEINRPALGYRFAASTRGLPAPQPPRTLLVRHGGIGLLQTRENEIEELECR